MKRRPEFLTTDWSLAAFGDERRRVISAFVRFVAEGKERESPWKDLKGQIYLGSVHFVEEMQKRIRPDQPLREIPLCQRRRMARSLADYTEQSPERDRAMAKAYRTGAYSIQAISDRFGGGQLTVRRAVKKHQLD